ncbi:MAG: TonB-dependent receptor [Bacteroidales bacterium]|nr:TonB-dependent receptor [Bacteroidales bacterium]
MKRFASIALTALTGLAASAQSSETMPADTTDYDIFAKELEQVVVTGTRTPKLLKNSPVLTRVISEDDLRKADATNIADLLQTELPGVEFSFSMNQQVSLNMQGFGGNSILFLVDGERLAGETLDNIDYNRLNLADAGKIEIVKGGASSLYGSNAVGGVINIISRDANAPWRVNLNAKVGAHAEQRYGLNASFAGKNVKSTTTFQWSHINSYNMKHAGDFSRFYGGHNYSLRERLSYQPIDRLSLTGRAGYYFRERNSAETSHDRYRDFSAGLKGVYDFNGGHNIEIGYTFDQYDKSSFQTITKSDVRNYSNVQHTVRAIANVALLTDYLLTLGADFSRDYLQSYQFENGGHKSQVTADGFAQLDFTPVKDFHLVAGGRFDFFSEASMKHLTANLSMMYRLGRTSLRASYSGGFRAPTLKEMYMAFDMAGIFMIYGNPDLKAESSHNFQASAEYARGNWSAGLGGFCNLVDQRITTAWSQSLKGQVYTNIGRVNIAGLEANVAWRSSLGLGARASYIFTHEHVRHGEPYSASTRPHTATLRFDYSKKWKNYGFSVVLNGRILSAVNVDEFTSATSYEDTERVHYPAYTIWKLSLSQDIYKGISLTLAADNLFNYVPKYYYSNSPATTGITLSAGLSVDLEKLCK